MNKIRMEVHPQEKELLETIRNEIVFGKIEIEITNGLPLLGTASRKYHFQKMAEKKKTGTEG